MEFYENRFFSILPDINRQMLRSRVIDGGRLVPERWETVMDGKMVGWQKMERLLLAR